MHRDLVARNVFVGQNETCKVTDFGMAKDVQQENIYERAGHFMIFRKKEPPGCLISFRCLQSSP